MDYIVPRNESWCGRYSQGTCELGTPWLTTWGNSSQHQGGVLVLDTLWNTKPLVVPIKTKGHGSWEEMDFGKPQRILIVEKERFCDTLKLCLWITLWNGWMTCCLIISRLYNLLWVYVWFKTMILINLFRAHYIPPSCTHGILSPHWVFLYSTLLYLLFLQDRNSWLYVGVHA